MYRPFSLRHGISNDLSSPHGRSPQDESGFDAHSVLHRRALPHRDSSLEAPSLLRDRAFLEESGFDAHSALHRRSFPRRDSSLEAASLLRDRAFLDGSGFDAHSVLHRQSFPHRDSSLDASSLLRARAFLDDESGFHAHSVLRHHTSPHGYSVLVATSPSHDRAFSRGESGFDAHSVLHRCDCPHDDSGHEAAPSSHDCAFSGGESGFDAHSVSQCQLPPHRVESGIPAHSVSKRHASRRVGTAGSDAHYIFHDPSPHHGGPGFEAHSLLVHDSAPRHAESVMYDSAPYLGKSGKGAHSDRFPRHGDYGITAHSTQGRGPHQADSRVYARQDHTPRRARYGTDLRCHQGNRPDIQGSGNIDSILYDDLGFKAHGDPALVANPGHTAFRTQPSSAQGSPMGRGVLGGDPYNRRNQREKQCETEENGSDEESEKYQEKKFLPSSTVRTDEERHSFCSEVLGSSSGYGHLVEDTIFNLGFVYEEGNDDFSKNDTNGKLTNLGILNLHRWRSGITAIHFVFPSDKQASNTRTAEGPHGQATFIEFAQAMQAYHGPEIRFQFYGPNVNHSTDFLFVLNGEAAHEYTSAINWTKVKQRIYRDSSTIQQNSTVRQATGNYADYGYCTSQNSNRSTSTTGHSMPALKPNSTAPEIVNVFVTLTKFAANTRPAWRPHNDHFEMMDQEMLSEFAKQIDDRNGLPSLHLAVTSVEHPCGCHNDATTNSKKHADVVCISVIEGEERISCNAQQRKSIDDYKLRCSEFGKPLLAIEQVYREMEPSRRSVTAELFLGEQVEYVPGFPTIRNECNMDPASYSMPVLSGTVWLGKHFNLSLPELHSVQIAFQVLPHSCMFFGVASEMLLQLKPSQIPADYRRGYGFGYLLACIVVDMFQASRDSGVQQTFRRWNNYREPLVPSRENWEERCQDTVVYCLHVCATYAKPSSKKVRLEQYKKISHALSDIWEGMGPLGANHSINQKACLGFLPAWCRELAIVDPASRVVKFFNDEYQLRKRLNRAELDRFLATLMKRLGVVFVNTFTDRIVENILCKAFRALSNKDSKRKTERWCDTLPPGQLIFQFEDDFIIVLSPNGDTEEVDGQAIMNRFPFGDRLLTMEELVAELGLPNVMPTESRMRKYCFYEKVWHPTVTFDVEFSFPPFIPQSKLARETTKRILSKWISSPPILRKRKHMHT
jgi:hypothetical protein